MLDTYNFLGSRQEIAAPKTPTFNLHWLMNPIHPSYASIHVEPHTITERFRESPFLASDCSERDDCIRENGDEFHLIILTPASLSLLRQASCQTRLGRPSQHHFHPFSQHRSLSSQHTAARSILEALAVRYHRLMSFAKKRGLWSQF
jgi:hypothetical protein